MISSTSRRYSAFLFCGDMDPEGRWRCGTFDPARKPQATSHNPQPTTHWRVVGLSITTISVQPTIIQHITASEHIAPARTRILHCDHSSSSPPIHTLSPAPAPFAMSNLQQSLSELQALFDAPGGSKPEVSQRLAKLKVSRMFIRGRFFCCSTCCPCGV
jgi:hypothetical protein